MEAQKTSLFAYLQQFDVEDIDLRKSPPGGWHGTYLHKIDGKRYETAPLTHSSVVRDRIYRLNKTASSLSNKRCNNKRIRYKDWPHVTTSY